MNLEHAIHTKVKMHGIWCAIVTDQVSWERATDASG